MSGYHLLRGVCLSLVVLALTTGYVVAPASAPFWLQVIGEPDPINYPDMQLHFRAVDTQTYTLPPLTRNDLKITENGVAVADPQLAIKNDGGLRYVFFLDVGETSNLNRLPRAYQAVCNINAAAGEYARQPNDAVEVWVDYNPGSNDKVERWWPPAGDTSNPAVGGWGDCVARLSQVRSKEATHGLQGVAQVLEKLTVSDNPVQPILVYFTRYLEGDVAAEAISGIVAQADNLAVPIYAFQTDRTERNGSLQPVGKRSLLQLVGGDESRYLSLDLEGAEPVAAARAVYEKIDQRFRTWYIASYMAAPVEASKFQAGRPYPVEVTLSVGEATARAAYSVTLEAAPVVVKPSHVAESADGKSLVVQRHLKRKSDGGSPILNEKNEYIYDTPEIVFSVTVDATWPDNHPRNLKSVKLLKDEQLVAEQTQPSAGGEYVFNVDVSNYTTSGEATFNVTVEAVDVVGITSRWVSMVTVDVEAKPCEVSFWSRDCLMYQGTRFGWLLVIGVALAVVFVGFWSVVAALAILRRTAVGRTETFQKIDKQVDRIKKTIIPAVRHTERRALAQITIMEGPPILKGQSRKIYDKTTIIGRDPKQCQIVFYPDEESSISGRHCTIQQDGDSFKITDHSSVGTLLNDNPLQPNLPEELRPGDVVVLGDLFNKGVQFEFNYVDEKTKIPGGEASPAAAQPELDAGYDYDFKDFK